MNAKRNIWISSIASAVVIAFLLLIMPGRDRTLVNVVGIVGFVLSILGLIIAIIQVDSVKQITKKTQQEVTDSLVLQSNILMISDIASKVSMVTEIQGYLRDDKIEICILRMKDMKIILNSIKNQGRYIGLVEDENFNTIFSTFHIDLDNIQRHLLNTKRKLDKSEIVKNMESLSSLLLSVDIKLKSTP